LASFAYATEQWKDVTKSFNEFMVKYNKSYSPVEYHERMEIFLANLEIAAQLDAADIHADYGITQFMDLTREEFRMKYLITNFTSPKKEGKNFPVLPQLNHQKRQLPENFNWNEKGVVTGVYNQGQCGSGWAFSTTENVESMWAIAGGGLKELSMQQLVDCAGNGNDGCGGGNPPWTYPYIISTGGMDSYPSYPYTGENGACHFKGGDVKAKISNWGYITTDDNEEYMAQWMYEYGPPSICVDATQWQYYTGGIITGNCGSTIDHCVQLTGWVTVQGVAAWLVRNSWGTSFGYDGYLYIAIGGDICAIGNEVTSSVI
jgi:C1A family cysteine protease